MDAATLAAYAAEWFVEESPDDMHALLRTHFAPGPAADVGCEAGRVSVLSGKRVQRLVVRRAA